MRRLWRCEDLQRKSDRVMTVVIALEEVVRIILCVHGPQSGRTGAKKKRFYDDLGNEWDLQNVGELVLGWEILMDMLGHGLRVIRVHGRKGIGERTGKERHC